MSVKVGSLFSGAGDLASCPCLRHANERRARGMSPPPLRIGEHVIQVLSAGRGSAAVSREASA